MKKLHRKLSIIKHKKTTSTRREFKNSNLKVYKMNFDRLVKKIIKKPQKDTFVEEKNLKSNKIINNRISIRTKLISFFTILSVLPIVIIISVIMNKVQNTIEKQAVNNLETIVYKTVENINTKNGVINEIALNLTVNKNISEEAVKTKENYKSTWEMESKRIEKIYNQFDALVISNKNINAIGIINDREVFASANEELGLEELEELRQSNYYEEVKNTNESIWISDIGENAMYCMKSNIVYKYVLVIKINVEYIEEVLDGKMISENSKITLLNGNEKNILSVIEEKDSVITKKEVFESLNKKYIESEGEDNSIILNDKNSIISYSMLDNGWYYIVKTPLNDYLKDLVMIRSFGIVIGAIACIVSVLIGIFISLNVEKPLRYIMNKMKYIEQGDLTVRSNIQGDKDMGKLSSSFNYMVENMSQLIENVNNLTEDVTATSNEVLTNANFSSRTTNEVILAIETVSTGASDQAMEADKTSEVIKKFVNLVSQAEENFNEVLILTNKALNASGKGNVVMKELNETTEDTLTISEKIKTDNENLNESLNKILSIIDIIGNISEQTNLLSLNAAIEVARAGEAGKAFGVIASEIRKLAEQSNGAAKKIVGIIEETNVVTNQTKKNVDQSIEIFNKQVEAINHITETFTEIVEEMNEVNSKTVEVNNKFLSVNPLKEEALKSITSIAAISENTAAAIEEVLATGDEQINVSKNLVDIANNLNDKINLMKESINKFKVN